MSSIIFKLMSRHGRLVLLLLLTVLSPAIARADDNLFVPIPGNRLSDATPAQNQRIDQIKKRRTTSSINLVRINLVALEGAKVDIAIPGEKTFSLSRRRIDAKKTGVFTWIGGSPAAGSEATLVVNNGKITGMIQSDGNLYRIEPLGGDAHIVVKINRSGFPPEHPPSFKATEQRAIRALAPGPKTTSNEPVEIDVLVAYTPSVLTSVGDIDATIQLAIDETNQSYLNSNINIRLNLVRQLEISYTETGKTFDTILADFVANATVAAQRNSSGADVSIMLINQNEFCGQADAILASASTAFAVVHYECATDYYSFGHEIGHLQGARHDPAHDPSTAPYAYGHGFQHTDPPPSWRTIMAYDCPNGCTRIQYWSNPRIMYNGFAMGTTDACDNARVLNETATTVAAFRSVPVPVTSLCPAGQKDCSMDPRPNHVPHCTDKTNYCCSGFGCDQPCVRNKCP